jgi:hypothetical protein
MNWYNSSTESSTYNLNRFQCLTRPLTNTDLIRVRRYSPLVRSIKYTAPGTSSFDPQRIAVGKKLIQELDQLYPISLMFPNLRRLTCDTPFLLESFPLCLFMGPQLRSLDFRTDVDAELFCRVIQMLTERCPLLEVLDLGALFVDRLECGHKFHSTILRFLTRCVNLRCLSIYFLPLQRSTIEAIASLPNLEKLMWRGPGDETYSAESFPRCFPEIIHYTQVDSANIPSLNTLASLITSNRLESYDVECRPPTCSEMHQLLSTLSARFDHEHPTRLALHQHFDEPKVEIADIRCLEPLLSFHNLNTFIFRQVCLFDDQAMVTLASSWPNLEVLRLSQYASRIKPYKITPKGFFVLIRGCPKLTELTIGTNFVADDLQDQIREMEMVESRPHMRSLSVGASTITEPESVAALFCRLFPELRAISHGPSPPKGGGGRPCPPAES